jgi:hypothetical protein
MTPSMGESSNNADRCSTFLFISILMTLIIKELVLYDSRSGRLQIEGERVHVQPSQPETPLWSLMSPSSTFVSVSKDESEWLWFEPVFLGLADSRKP